MNSFEIEIQPDFEGLRRCVLRQGEPARVYNIELLLDEEILSPREFRGGIPEFRGHNTDIDILGKIP